MKTKSSRRHRETNLLFELHQGIPVEIMGELHRLGSFAARLSYIWELIQNVDISREQFGTVIELARKPQRSNEDPESVLG